jgi:predicted kinase
MRAEKYRALMLVGGPGSGKDILLRTIFKESNVLEINLDQLYKVIQEQAQGKVEPFYAMKKINEGDPIVVNGSARRDNKIELVKTVLEGMGYETEICVVTTTNDVSKARNDARISSGTKTITEVIRQSKWNESSEYARLNEGSAMIFDNSQYPENMAQKLQTLQRWVNSFFVTRAPTLDEEVAGFLDENLKRSYDAHKSLELSIKPDKPKTGVDAYHKYNLKRNASKKTTSTVAPVSPEHSESSDGAYLSTEAKETKGSFKTFRKTTKPPINVQYVGDPQGVGGATADLREDKKVTKSKSAKPPTVNADERVGDDQALTTTLGMVGEQTKRSISLRRLREEVSVKSLDEDFVEIYEDIGLDGEKVIYEGRAVTTNKPFKRGDKYSVYVKTETNAERLDFGNHKRVLQEIFDVLSPEINL